MYFITFKQIKKTKQIISGLKWHSADLDNFYERILRNDLERFSLISSAGFLYIILIYISSFIYKAKYI